MKRSLLTRLRSNGSLYLISALLLLLGVPLYQSLVLGPTGFARALDESGAGRYNAYLSWINSHSMLFLGYRALLLIGIALLLTLPFSLYRIIVAQELMAQQEQEAGEQDKNGREPEQDTQESQEVPENMLDGMPAYAWRGKGFAVLAAWSGLIGLIIYVIGLIASTFYFVIIGGTTPGATATYASIFTIITNTVGIGLLGLSILFFGAMIARTGTNLWPRAWVTFGYAALFVGALLCISAVAVVSTPGSGQSSLTTIATFLLAIWSFWLGIMLIRLKPED